MPKSEVLRHGRYTIQQTEAQSFDYDKHPHLLALSNITTWTLWAGYLVVQALVIRKSNTSTGSIPWRYWVGLFAELCISMNDLAHALHLLVRLLSRATVQLPRPHYLLLHDDAPTVDALVVCCGEPVDIVVNTAISVAAQDYPKSRLRVLVCDDGHNQDLRVAIEKLDVSGQFEHQILYGARSDKGKDYKAGNLRFGINETAKLGEGGGGEIVACLDADMIANPQWLRRMVPHLVLDSKMGMVNQPQHYYNTAENDPLSDQGEYDMWFTIFEPLNDRVGQAMCQGSGWLVRRSALEDIGGWPIAQTGEDVMCALKLLHHGWKLSYVREYLQHGRTADTFGARVTQKIRWAIDHIAFVKTFGLRSTTNILGALTWRDFTAVTSTLGLILLPLTLLFSVISDDYVVVPTENYSLVSGFLVLSYLAGKLNDWVVYRHFGLTRISKYQSLELWSAPYKASALIENSLPGAAAVTFSVTGTFKSEINERSKQTRAGLVKRLLSPGIRILVAYVLISLMLVLRSLQMSKSMGDPVVLGSSQILILPGPILKMTSCIWKMSVPIFYMIFPPNVPEWEDLVEGDAKGALKPKRAIDPIMSPAGSEKDTSFARVWYDALELSILACYLT